MPFPEATHAVVIRIGEDVYKVAANCSRENAIEAAKRLSNDPFWNDGSIYNGFSGQAEEIETYTFAVGTNKGHVYIVPTALLDAFQKKFNVKVIP